MDPIKEDALVEDLLDAYEAQIQYKTPETLELCFDKMILLGPEFYAKHSEFRNVCISKILELKDHASMTEGCQTKLLHLSNTILEAYACMCLEWSAEDDENIGALSNL